MCETYGLMVFVWYQNWDEWNIQIITWDEKDDKIILVGQFDPDKLIPKLYCKACNCIKKCIIPPPPPPPDEKPPAPPPPPPPPPPSFPCVTCQICHCGSCHGGHRPCKSGCSNDGYGGHGCQPPVCLPPPPPPPPLCVTGKICLCGSCHKGHRPCNSGCSNDGCGGHGCVILPPPPPVCGPPTCQIYYDDGGSNCSIM